MAIRYLERARPDYDFEARLFIYLAVSHFRLGEQQEAQTLIQRAVQVGPDDPDAFYCRAEIYQRVDVRAAIADLERYMSMVAALGRVGVAVSDRKTERVRRMHAHLLAITRGEASPEEIFDPVRPLDRALMSPRLFAIGATALALVFAAAGASVWVLRRRQRR